MTIRHLRVFQAVCAAGSVTGAAGALYMTQPAVSRAIRELEEETGLALFDRLSHRLCLTPTGALYLEKAGRLLALYGELEEGAKAMECRAPLRLGSSITIANYHLPPLLRRFAARCPDTPVRVTVERAAAVLVLLEEGSVDMAFVEGIAADGPFRRFVFSHYELLTVCAPDHPCAGASLPLERLAGEDWLLREKGSAVRETFDSALLLRGLAVEPTWTSVNSQALVQAAMAGLGLTILPDRLVEEELRRGTLAQVKVEDCVLRNTNALLVHRDKGFTEPMEILRELTLQEREQDDRTPL